MSETDAILDLRERIVDGVAMLQVEAIKHPYGSMERARLAAKAAGLAVALDYIRHSLSLASQEPS